MWIGSKAHSQERICPDIDLNWVKEIKLLGNLFEPKCLGITSKNILMKKETILQTIKQWQNTLLTLTGRIIIAKTLLLPQITHVLSSLPDPSAASLKKKSQIFCSPLYGARNGTQSKGYVCAKHCPTMD